MSKVFLNTYLYNGGRRLDCRIHAGTKDVFSALLEQLQYDICCRRRDEHYVHHLKKASLVTTNSRCGRDEFSSFGKFKGRFFQMLNVCRVITDGYYRLEKQNSAKNAFIVRVFYIIRCASICLICAIKFYEKARVTLLTCWFRFSMSCKNWPRLADP